MCLVVRKMWEENDRGQIAFKMLYRQPSGDLVTPFRAAIVENKRLYGWGPPDYKKRHLVPNHIENDTSASVLSLIHLYGGAVHCLKTFSEAKRYKRIQSHVIYEDLDNFEIWMVYGYNVVAENSGEIAFKEVELISRVS